MAVKGSPGFVVVFNIYNIPAVDPMSLTTVLKERFHILKVIFLESSSIDIISPTISSFNEYFYEHIAITPSSPTNDIFDIFVKINDENSG